MAGFSELEIADCQTRPPLAAERPVNSSRALVNETWQALALRSNQIRPKLDISQPGDAYEQEADQVADLIMRSSSALDPFDQSPSATANGSPLFSSSRQSPNATTLAFAGLDKKHDFDDVRVHTDSEAAATARGIGARAFTMGNRIAFAPGEFAPETVSGRRLIAHELAHVAQQSRGGVGPLVQRALALSGRKTTEHVDDSIAGDVDKALAQSKTIAKYVPAKSLKPTKGHLSVDLPDVFSSYYGDYAKKHSDMPDVKDVHGFTDRDAGEIKLKLNSANVEDALHEGVHLNSSAQFQRSFGHAFNEGVTEYFSEKVLAEQGLSGGKAYRDEMKLADGLVALLGEDQVGRAYFQGDLTAYKTIIKALGNNVPSWRHKIVSKDPADWEAASAQLKQAFGR